MPLNPPGTVFVVVELEEGVRLFSNVLVENENDVDFDVPVEVCFEAVASESKLPVFRLVGCR